MKFVRGNPMEYGKQGLLSLMTLPISPFLKIKKYQNEREQAYADLRRITIFLNNSFQKFDPLNFSLNQAYKNLFSTILQKQPDDLLPTHALVIPYESLGFTFGTFYWQESGFIQEKRLNFSNSLKFNKIWDLNSRNDLFINVEKGKSIDLPEEISALLESVKNFVSCYSDGMLVICFNYKKAVTKFDLHVLKDLAMHLIFFETMANQIKENENAFLYTIKALARAAEQNDEDTGNHIIRVGEFSCELAKELGLSHDLADNIRYSAQMHDVGKIHTPAHILKKPGKLSSDEWAEIKKHPLYAIKILGGSPRLEVARQIALSHHERWDGSGYPYGKKGEEIPLPARIVAISDVYDALRNRRPYKPGFNHKTACKIILEGDKGRTKPSQFDPQILKIFKRIEPRFREIYSTLED